MSDSSTRITDRLAEERSRNAGQSQIIHLQNQIDELHRMLRDQTQKYQLAVEQVRHNEQQIAEIKAEFVRQTQTVEQTVESFRRDMGTIRKEFSSLVVKVEDGVRPIRDMQAQIQELADARKTDRVSVAGLINRINEVEQKVGSLFALVREADERYRSINTRLDTFQSTEDTRRVELRQILEDVQVEKQQLRRQAVENQQLVADSKLMIAEQQSRILRIDDYRTQIDKIINDVPEQLMVLGNRIAELLQETKKIERTSNENFLANQQRIEEIRLQQDDKISTIQEAEDRHLRQISSWIERVDSYVRDLEQRLTKTTTRLDNLHYEHSNHVTDIDNRDIDLLTSLNASIQTMLERIKNERMDTSSSSNRKS
jgi:chromosome segregation ATPase